MFAWTVYSLTAARRPLPRPATRSQLPTLTHRSYPQQATGNIQVHCPDLWRLIKSAIRAISANLECGEPLKLELEGLCKYRVRRFRIDYAVHQKTRVIRLMAVGHRRSVYEELTERIRQKPRA